MNIEETEITVLVPVKAKVSKCDDGNSFVEIDDKEIANLYFVEDYKDGDDLSALFRNHLITYNEVQSKIIRGYEKRLNIAKEEEQDEIWEELSQIFSWCIHGDDYFFDEERFMGLKEDYIIIRKPKEEVNQTK